MKKNLLTVSLWGIYLLFLSCRPASNRQAVYNFAPLDSIITGWIDKEYYPGAAICVVRDDSIIFWKNYKEFTPDTKVYVASAGKWVAAAVIGAVVDRTDLDWNDNVKKWIPEFKNDVKGMITLRQLLSHTSGVPPRTIPAFPHLPEGGIGTSVSEKADRTALKSIRSFVENAPMTFSQTAIAGNIPFVASLISRIMRMA